MSARLFDIQFTHDYFRDGILRDVAVTPCSRTAMLLRRYGLTCRNSNGCFSVHYHGKSTLENLLPSLSGLIGEQPLVFDVAYPTANIHIFTDFPLDWRGTISYTTSRVAPANDSNTPNELAPEFTELRNYSTGPLARICIHADVFAPPSSNRRYRISLKTRRTHWRYYVFSSDNDKLRDPRLSRSSTNLTMGTPVTARALYSSVPLIRRFLCANATIITVAPLYNCCRCRTATLKTIYYTREH